MQIQFFILLYLEEVMCHCNQIASKYESEFKLTKDVTHLVVMGKPYCEGFGVITPLHCMFLISSHARHSGS